MKQNGSITKLVTNKKNSTSAEIQVYLERNKQMHEKVRCVCSFLLHSYRSLQLPKEIVTIIAKYVFSSRFDVSLWFRKNSTRQRKKIKNFLD